MLCPQDDPAAYFGNVSMDEVEGLVRKSLGFTAADIAAAHTRARAAGFASDAARLTQSLRQRQADWGVGDGGAIGAAVTLLLGGAALMAGMLTWR